MTLRTTDEGFPLTPAQRCLLGLWSLALVGLFVIASRLTPDPQGFSTHEQLGLPPCTLRMWFGISCPTCGMTTSFAHVMHGEPVAALRANVAGCLLAMCGLIQIPWCWWSLYQGRLWKVRRPVEASLVVLGTAAGISLVCWTWKMVQPFWS
ncbi:MAG: DUF2752 domain-containing protein [Planctomycetales bacterium]